MLIILTIIIFILKQTKNSVCKACDQESSRDGAKQNATEREIAREGQANTRKPLYSSLNTEGHLPNITSLFLGQEK